MMASISCLSMLSFFTQIILARARLNLQPSDHYTLVLERPVPLTYPPVESLSAVPRRYIFAENSGVPQKHENINPQNLRGWILGFFSGSVSAVLSLLALSTLFAIINNRSKGPAPTIYDPRIRRSKELAFLLKEDGVASFEQIGRGAGGIVYKAQLPGSDGVTIAIKKIILPKDDAAELIERGRNMMTKKMRQIESEIRICGLIRHRNILNFLALVPRHDCYYLVYEYLRNGSLQHWLNVSGGREALDWLSRLRIAMGVAAGLEYLHMNYNPRIIHRDLKPANILLDDNMEARITDFGISKVLPDGHTHATTSNVAGTAGYIAPEYHHKLELTEKCDIYSFGVILGVLVMGKLPTDEFFQTTIEMNLVKWMRNVMASEDPSVAIDSNLMGSGFEEEMLLILKIACLCTLDDPKERPSSKDVSIMLSQIRVNIT